MYQRIKYRIYAIKKIFPYGEKRAQYVVVFLILSSISLLSGILSPQIYNMFINNVILGGQLSKLKYVIIGYLLFFFIDITVSYLPYQAIKGLGSTVNTTTLSSLSVNLILVEFPIINPP